MRQHHATLAFTIQNLDLYLVLKIVAKTLRIAGIIEFVLKFGKRFFNLSILVVKNVWNS